MNVIPLERVIAKAARDGTGKTRNGDLVTVETEDLRRAAAALGGCLESNCLRFGKAIRALGGERIANGHRSARYGFAAATMASIIEQHKDD